MKTTLKTAAALVIAGSAAQAGGLDKSGQKLDSFFEKGTHAEFGFSYASPNVTGTHSSGNSGKVPNAGFNYGAAFKTDLSDKTSVALIFDRPFAADVAYSEAGYFLDGTTADLNAHALTGLVRYKFDNNFSLYGGLRAQTLKASTRKLINGGTHDYNIATESDQAFGYALGFAWENPKKAQRITLTYNSAITHENAAVEDYNSGTLSGTDPVTIKTPQSINFNARTAINRRTVVFAGARWVDWSDFKIDPSVHNAVFASPLVSYQKDRITYNVGVGRAINKKLSGSLSLTYEPSNGLTTGNLGPVDGRLGITAGLRYKQDDYFVQGGVSYVMLGDATTSIGASFSGNSALGVGFKIGRKF